MKKDFIIVTPDSGTGDKTITVQATENTGHERSTSLSINGNGITKTIAINQEAGGTLITNFQVEFRSGIFIAGGPGGTEPFNFFVSIQDSSGIWKTKQLELQPGENVDAPSGSFVIKFTSSDGVRVLDTNNVNLRIGVEPFVTTYAGYYLGSCMLARTGALANFGECVLEPWESYFRKIVNRQNIIWTSVQGELSYAENLRIACTGYVGAGTDLGSLLFQLNQK